MRCAVFIADLQDRIFEVIERGVRGRAGNGWRGSYGRRSLDGSSDNDDVLGNSARHQAGNHEKDAPYQ